MHAMLTRGGSVEPRLQTNFTSSRNRAVVGNEVDSSMQVWKSVAFTHMHGRGWI